MKKEGMRVIKKGKKMIRKVTGFIFIYLISLVVGGLAAGLLSIPFIIETNTSIARYVFFLGVVTLVYSILIIPVISVFHFLVSRFLPHLYLLNLYPVFAYAIFGVNHFLAGFTFFHKNYWPMKIAAFNADHLIVLAIAAALSGSTAIYANIGLEKIKNYYQKSSAEY